MVIVVDQLTKIWAVAALEDGPFDLPWTFQFRLIRNYNSSFSFRFGSGWFVSLIALVVVLFLFRSLRTAQTNWSALGVGFVGGGAVGNVIDRVLRAEDGWFDGGVVDYVDPGWFPVFNVADAGITVGAIVLVVASLFDDRRTARLEVAAAHAEPTSDGTDADPKTESIVDDD